MRVIVTRPAHSARRTAERLAGLGHEPVIMPLFDPAHMPEMATAALSAPWDWLAATSAEALRSLSSGPPLKADHLAKPFFAVGKATAQAATRYGFSNVVLGPGDGAGLANDLVARSRAGSGSHLVYLAGRPRNPTFEEILTEGGVTVTVAEIYDMRPVEISLATQQDLLVNQRTDVVMLYSRQTAERFSSLPVFTNTTAALDRTVFICMSQAIASGLPQGLRHRAVVALRPDEDAMIDLL